MQEGVDKIGTSAPEKVKLGLIASGKANKLADLDEYTFFSPGIVYTHVDPDQCNPLHDFLAELNDSTVQPVIMNFQKRVFAGLGPWDRLLVGLPTIHWPAFLSFMGQVAVLDRANKRYIRVRPQTVTILDPVAIDKHHIADNVELIVFGLDTNLGKVYMQTGAIEPYLTSDREPYEDTLAMGKALFADSNNPYGDAAAPQG